jgi:hypothetical protein
MLRLGVVFMVCMGGFGRIWVDKSIYDSRFTIYELLGMRSGLAVADTSASKEMCVPFCSFLFFCVPGVHPQNAGARKRPFILDGAFSRRRLLVGWGFWVSPAAFVLDALALVAFSSL